eukprot:5293280-Amphidinium_carterae.1
MSGLGGDGLIASLANNNIQEFPVEWFHLPHVKQLDIRNNNITHWPAAGIFHRGYVTADGNPGSCYIPSEAPPFVWPEMELLQLSGNPLNGEARSVLGSLAPLERLQTLEVEDASLTLELPMESNALLPAGINATTCDFSGLRPGFPALIVLKMARNKLTGLYGPPWRALQQADFADNRLQHVDTTWFGEDAPLFLDLRGNRGMSLEVTPPTGSCTAGIGLVASPGGYTQELSSNGTRSECTSLCNIGQLIYVDSQVNTTALCRCAAGFYGEGEDCSMSGLGEWSGVGALRPVPCPNGSSTLGQRGRTMIEDCECNAGRYR